MATKRAAKAKSSTKARATKKASSTRAQKTTKKGAKKASGARAKTAKLGGMVIQLTAAQQEQLRKLSNGAIDARTIRLRPELDVQEFLAKIVDLLASRATLAPEAGGIAPPPKDTAWV